MVTRRLSAILAADVVGYSRLIRADEEGTLAALNILREDIIVPKIAAHRGRIVKLMGDGILAEFSSVVDAVCFAAEFQQELVVRNAKSPQGSSIEFRVGVNLGDVVIDGDDIQGDGVNLAARLEGIAEPGGVCISSSVHEQVRDRLDLTFADMGEQVVKNIDRPLRVWQWRVGGEADARSIVATGPSEKPSIAVMPFGNMSGDPEQEYFADGIAEDILTDLSKISGLFVIARNSSFSYKGQTLDPKHLAGALGVKFVLEGSVRKAGDRVRITAQLIDGASGGQLWADRYDGKLEDIFSLQDEITIHIVEALKIKLNLGEQDRIGGRGTNSIEAYDFTLRARDLVFRFTPEANLEAQHLYEQSIALDPNFASAYAELAIALLTAYVSGWNNASEEMLQRGVECALTSVELDPADPQARRALALGHLWSQNLDSAVAEIGKATEFGPGTADIFATQGNILGYASRPAEAVESLQRAMRLNPHFPGIWLHFLGHAYFVLKDYKTAVSVLEQRIRRDPETDMSRVLVASCYGHLGLNKNAMQHWQDVCRINPDYSIERKSKILPYKNVADWNRFKEGLLMAEIPV